MNSESETAANTPPLESDDGLVRVKLMGNGCSSKELCQQWDRMSQGNLRWNDLQVTWEDTDIDFYVIVNYPGPGDHYVPERTVVLQMEPWCGEAYQTWGVKTWGEWADPDPSRFLHVRTHRSYLNTVFWQLAASWRELKTDTVVKTRTLSSICSAKYFDPGHRKRVDFLKFLEARDDDIVRVDVWAHDNPLEFKNWVGPHPQGVKDAALKPYKYFFAAENNQERNFITEKLWEPLLTESLCFYWGCPNATDWVDARAFIPLDLDNFEAAFQTMKSAILANEWEKRLEVIRREKQKILDGYQFFPMLEQILRRESGADSADTEAVGSHYFEDTANKDIQTVAFVHSFARGPRSPILAELLYAIEVSGLLGKLDHLYINHVGEEISLPGIARRYPAKVRFIVDSGDACQAEQTTLNLVHSFSKLHANARILYLHTKGASYDPPNAHLADWRRMMTHFLVERYSECLETLETSDAMGCNLLEQPRRHFSGNFWWANAKYLRKLKAVPTGNRQEAEWWVLRHPGATAVSCHNSGIDHYQAPYPASRYAPATVPASTRTSICLVMIVRDEAHVVLDALNSLLPFISDFLVVDTGSTDGTQDIIRTYMASRGIHGQVIDRPWKDFGWNRSEALDLARDISSSGYLWMFDADDLVAGLPDLKCLTADAYHLRFGPDNEYRRLQIFRRTIQWRYVGVLHEYPQCTEPSPELGEVGGDYWIISRRLGNRNRDPKKYEKDAKILQAALATEPNNARYAFYLAQSWFDAGRPGRALKAYRQREKLGGFEEEIFYSRYRAAHCLKDLGRPLEEVLEAYEQCFLAHPQRAEPLVRAANLAGQNGKFDLAYDFASRALGVRKPGSQALFVEVADYQYRAMDEKAIAAFYLGRQVESFHLCEQLLANPDLPEAERARIEGNRAFSVCHMEEAFLFYDAGKVAQLASRVCRDSPRVTLSITTCRRLSHFVDTVCSFLNACSDIDRIDRFLCIDDGSSKADRAEMKRLFPFFDFVFKGAADKGHARSLNQVMRMVETPYLLHLEDDWRFFSRGAYVGAALEILEENAHLGQVLFNRNYAETLADREIPGGLHCRTKGSGLRFVLHEHHPPDSPELHEFQARHGYAWNAYWPHFSLRPGLMRTSALKRVGQFDEEATHFELDFARRYSGEGFRSAFLDGISAKHTGRLTSQRDEPGLLNAYGLNEEAQFGQRANTPVSTNVVEHEPCRVKLIGNWATSKDLCTAFSRQAKLDGRWDEIEITDGENADYFALFNFPRNPEDHFRPDRTIVFSMEPPHAAAHWGDWSAPDPARFLQVRHHDRFPNCGEWHLGRTWSQLKSTAIEPKTRVFSAIVSSKVRDPGHGLRLSFLKHLEKSGFHFDVYGYDNAHGFRSYRGALPARNKLEGLLPYRYTLAAENSAHPNYFTEKILDAILAECLPFYWGCTNLEDHLDPRAFIRLPLEDPEASRRIVEQSIADETWSRRIEVIRKEKQRILDELQLFPTLARVVRGHRLSERLGIRLINLDRRPDRLESFTRRVAEAAGPALVSRITRFPAVDGRLLSMTPEIRWTFRDNDFSFRRNMVACALSHMALWEELAASDFPGFLIFEDDVHLCRGFMGQLVEICGTLENRHPGFDMVLLGHSEVHKGQRIEFKNSCLPASLEAFDGARYLGGLFAYIISRKGAKKLMDLSVRDGVQHGIDRFIHSKEAELEILVSAPSVASALLVPPGSGLDSDIQNDFEELKA